MTRSDNIPRPALLLGLGGLIPFAAGAAISFAPNAELARHGLMALTFYAAVILSFLGGVRWGALIAAPALESGQQDLPWSGMILSVMPSLVAWPALLLRPAPALILLLAGFLIQFWLDVIAAREGRLPRWYGLRLRTLLSAGAITALIAGLLATLLRINV